MTIFIKTCDCLVVETRPKELFMRIVMFSKYDLVDLTDHGFDFGSININNDLSLLSNYYILQILY